MQLSGADPLARSFHSNAASRSATNPRRRDLGAHPFSTTPLPFRTPHPIGQDDPSRDGGVKADTRAYRRREKKCGDLFDRAIKELEAIAFHDIREVADWRRKFKFNADGEVVGTDCSLTFRDAEDLPASASKAIKSVFLKSGAPRIDMHDKTGGSGKRTR